MGNRRTAARLAAAIALLVVAAAILVVVLSGGDGGADRGGPARPAQGRSAGRVVPATPGRGVAPVRNASPQPGWRPHSGPVPIFRYHAVGDFAAGESAPELFVAAADFRGQMEWLADHGYQAVNLRTVERAWTEGGTLPRRPVVLSFDGVRDELATTVAPELRRRGWPALLVLDAEAPLARRGAVERLLGAGWEVAAEGADPAAARRALEAKLGAPVENYAYPQGEAAATSAAVAAAGYRGATVVGPGFAAAAEPYELPRITVFGLTRVDGFAAAMRSRGEGVGA